MPLVASCGESLMGVHRGDRSYHAERRATWLGAVHLEQRGRVRDAEVEHTEGRLEVGNAHDSHAVDLPHHPGITVRLSRDDRAAKAQPGGFREPLRQVAHPSELTGQTKLAELQSHSHLMPSSA